VNGFGRIGRTLCRALWAREDLDVELVAANDIQPLDQLAYLLEFDSIAGRLPQRAEVAAAELVVGERRVQMLQSPAPEELAWGDLVSTW
jgi:glyceraldehyde 3-phosphate dehydrogenase